LLQYCSDGGNDNNDVMYTDDKDDDSWVYFVAMATI
jgi:hypothetical protein